MGIPPLDASEAQLVDTDTAATIARIQHRRKQLEEDCEQLAKRMRTVDTEEPEAEELSKEGAAFLKRKLEDEAASSSKALRSVHDAVGVIQQRQG